MGKNRLFCFFLLMICSYTLKAQENRFMVFFKDKAHSPFTLDKPEEFLSPKALERRAEQNISLTFNDLPVSPAYLDSLKEAGVPYYHKSKWFNGVLIQTDSTTLDKLKDASYIKSMEYVAPGAKLKNPYQSISTPSASGRMADRSTREKGEAPVEHAVMLHQNVMMDVPEMHQQGFRGEGMRIAVLDGGFLNVDEHAAFAPLFEENRIIATKNFVVNNDSVYLYAGHGTKALSCIGAVIPNEFVGTAPQAEFLLCITEDVSGEYRIEEYNWLFAAEFADSAGIDIISTSLGYTTFSDASMNYDYEDLDGHTAVITRAAVAAASKGMVLVISAGNEGSNSWKYISAPADADSILAVGAVKADGLTRAYFSSFGPTADGRLKPDVSALGYGVATVNANGKVAPGNGTSFAAPLISGFVAGFWQANPELSNIEVIERIKMSGNKAMAPNNEVGYGVPDFTRAMEEVVLGSYIKDAKSFRIFPNPVLNNKLVIEMSSDQAKEDLKISLYNSAGKLIKSKFVPGYAPAATVTLDFQNILPGIYIINVVTSKTSEAAKVVKF